MNQWSVRLLEGCIRPTGFQLNWSALDLWPPHFHQSRSESPGLGKVMLQHAPFLRMYADYVRNFDQAMELVRTWTERSSAFRNIIQDIQVKTLSSRLISTYSCASGNVEVWAECSVCIVVGFFFRVGRSVAAWLCSTTCWNQSRGSHVMRCCSGITWRNCQRITQIMSLLTVSILHQCLYSHLLLLLPYWSVYKYAWSEWACVRFGSCHKFPVCLWGLIWSFNEKNELSFVSSYRVLADHFHGSNPLKQRHPQSCTLPSHTTYLSNSLVYLWIDYIFGNATAT